MKEIRRPKNGSTPLQLLEAALRERGYRPAWSNRLPSMSWKCHAWTGPALVLLLASDGADGCELFIPASKSNRIDATIAAIPTSPATDRGRKRCLPMPAAKHSTQAQPLESKRRGGGAAPSSPAPSRTNDNTPAPRRKLRAATSEGR